MPRMIESKGPKEWNLIELRMADAIDVGKVQEPDLDFDGKRLPLLSIFAHDRWEVPPEEFELLKPSIQLASNLVRVGIPYIANFLPLWDGIFNDGEYLDEIDQSKEELTAALDSLENLSLFTRWQINTQVFQPRESEGDGDLSWMGIARHSKADEAWDILTDEEAARSDASWTEQESQHRRLVIGISGEFVKTIRDSPKDSEQHLRVSFMAGVNMAHEVGHAIFHREFTSYNPSGLEKPYADNDRSAELGVAFIKWIFGGFLPEPASVKGVTLTDAPLQWTEYSTRDIGQEPFYKTVYSISVPWIEEKLRQSWWDNLPPGQHLNDFSSEAKVALKPIINSTATEVATARSPEWEYVRKDDEASRKRKSNFQLRGNTSGDIVEALAEEEIALVNASPRPANPDVVFASTSPEEPAQAQSRNSRMHRQGKGRKEHEKGVKFSNPLPLSGVLSDTGRNLSPQFPIITFGNEPTPAELLAATRADPAVQRQAAVVLKRANPTFAELLTSIGRRAPKLDQMLLGSGKRRRIDRGGMGAMEGGELRKGGLEILTEVEDLKEAEWKRRKAFEALVEGKGEVEERAPMDGYPAPGTSHMVDLFYATSKFGLKLGGENLEIGELL